MSFSLAIDINGNYCRSMSSERLQLEEEICKLYQQPKEKLFASIFPSGMAAISQTMQTIALNSSMTTHKDNNFPIVFIISDELYCDTPRVARFMTNLFPNLIVETFHLKNAETNLLDLFQKHQSAISLLFFEGCSNPGGQMIDFEVLKQCKRMAPKCQICVDNTWTTSVLFNPFTLFGTDLVIESLSKYMSSGSCIGGMVVGKKKIINKVKSLSRSYGQFVGADHCSIFLNSLSSLEERVLKASKLATEGVNWMIQEIPESTVVYPYQKDHPTFQTNEKYLKRGPGVFIFHYPTGKSKDEICQLFRDNSHISFVTSFGGKHSKVDPWPEIGFNDKYSPATNKERQQGIWLRISVGFEDSLESLKTLILLIISEINSKSSSWINY